MGPPHLRGGALDGTLALDTIAALATAPGLGAVAMVRLSGPDAFGILRRIGGELPEPVPVRRARLMRISGPGGRVVDRAVVTCFAGPASYTGEDVVELSGHGGWSSPQLVLDACLGAGARRAEPGEFTRRAYLNGKLDLVQAEAVLDLVEGRSRVLHDAALHQLERGLSVRITEAREGLVELEALLVHHLDFPEEDDGPTSVEHIAESARGVAAGLEVLLRTAPEGELLREGALTVLAGRPNVGKSSLFNALLGEERTIVTEEPGTTRDAIEAVVSLRGFPFRLVDTAGLRSTREPVEQRGMEVARRYLDRADVVLFCAEVGRETGPEEEEFLTGLRAPVVRVRTKADLGAGTEGEAGDAPNGELAVSVRDGSGLAAIREALAALVFGGLVAAHREVVAFADALVEGVPAEVAATHLRPAETALEELLGVIAPDEVLDRVFGRFCIGK